MQTETVRLPWSAFFGYPLTQVSAYGDLPLPRPLPGPIHAPFQVHCTSRESTDIASIAIRLEMPIDQLRDIPLAQPSAADALMATLRKID